MAACHGIRYQAGHDGRPISRRWCRWSLRHGCHDSARYAHGFQHPPRCQSAIGSVWRPLISSLSRLSLSLSLTYSFLITAWIRKEYRIFFSPYLVVGTRKFALPCNSSSSSSSLYFTRIFFLKKTSREEERQWSRRWWRRWRRQTFHSFPEETRSDRWRETKKRNIKTSKQNNTKLKKKVEVI